MHHCAGQKVLETMRRERSALDAEKASLHEQRSQLEEAELDLAAQKVQLQSQIQHQEQLMQASWIPPIDTPCFVVEFESC